MRYSPGCQCCGGGLSNTCADCTGKLPPLKLVDSVYGGPVNLVNSVATNPNAQVQGAADCSHPGTITMITTTLTYTLSCHTGSPPYLAILVSYYWCCSQAALAAGPPCSSFIGSQHVPIVNLDCTNPHFSFVIPATPGVNPYNGGATITVTKQ
jgi:hypothetical protein